VIIIPLFPACARRCTTNRWYNARHETQLVLLC